MNAYQKLKEYQDEIEKLTGFRPHIQIHIYDHYYPEHVENEFRMARNLIVLDSGGELEPFDTPMNNDSGVYVTFKAESRQISANIYGPKQKGEKPNEDSL